MGPGGGCSSVAGAGAGFSLLLRCVTARRLRSFVLAALAAAAEALRLVELEAEECSGAGDCGPGSSVSGWLVSSFVFVLCDGWSDGSIRLPVK